MPKFFLLPVKRLKRFLHRNFFKQIETPENSTVEERSFADFFARLTEVQDWFGDEETSAVNKYSDLKSFVGK